MDPAYRLVDLTPAREAEWQAFADERGGVFHSLGWRRALEETFGYASRYLLLLDGGERIAGLLPLMIARNLRLARVAVSLPFVNYLDLCCRDDAARAALRRLLPTLPGRLGVRSVELRLLENDIEGTGASIDRSNVTFFLPLDQGEEGVLAGCTATNRNHVRKVYRREIFESDTESQDLDIFYALFARRQKELGTPVPRIDFYRRIREELPGKTLVLTVRLRDTSTPVAAMFLFAPGDTLHYVWGGGDVKYNRDYVNVFMYWEALRYAIARGFRWLDLGRSSTAGGHGGTYAFKAQFGGIARPLTYARFGDEGASTAQERAQLSGAVSLWKKLPDAVTSPLGAFLIRYVIP
jgi:serine/alanine adding enzyme